MDPLSQILNAHVAVKIRIFHIQFRQHIFDAQIKIVYPFKFCQTTQQPHRLCLINTYAEQKQPIIRPAFFNSLRPSRSSRNFTTSAASIPLFAHATLLIYSQRHTTLSNIWSASVKQCHVYLNATDQQASSTSSSCQRYQKTSYRTFQVTAAPLYANRAPVPLNGCSIFLLNCRAASPPLFQ